MTNSTTESYIPLSRGLKDHLPGMAKGYRLALYIYLLLEASYKGKYKGKVSVSFPEIAILFEVHPQTIYKAARELREGGYITYTGAKNQHSATVVTICKYKTVEDFIRPAAVSSETQSEYRASRERVESRPGTASKSKDLQGPNNNKECKDIYTVEIEEVFDAYKVIMEVRSRSDSRKSKIWARLKEYGKSEVLRAIENYRLALDDPENHWTHRFPVEDFMTPKNIDRFLAMEPPAEEEWKEMPDAH